MAALVLSGMDFQQKGEKGWDEEEEKEKKRRTKEK